MKKIFAIVSLLAAFTFNVNAGLITNESVDSDGNLIVDFLINDTNQELSEFGFALGYDLNVLTWDESYGDDALGFQPNYAVLDYVFADGEDLDYDGIFDVYGWLDDGWVEEYGTDILLGSAKFFVDGNLEASNFDVELTYAWDFAGEDVPVVASAVAEVPEPPAMAIFGLLLLGLAHKRRKNVG